MEYGFAPILLDREICRDYARSSALEWLVGNETGGYSMGTVAGVNTRRYHGLLIAALDPPAQRCVTLSKIDEQVDCDSVTYDLAVNAFADGVRPCGYELLDLFRLDPYPIWVWTLDGASFIKRTFLIRGKPAVAIQYSCSKPCLVKARPLIACRDYHSAAHANDNINTAIEHGPGSFRIHPYPDLPAIHAYFGDDAEFEEDGRWVHGLEYEKDRQRGEQHCEDLYSPGVIKLRLEPGRVDWIVVDAGGKEAYDGPKVRNLAEQYRNIEIKGNTPFEARLTAASLQFRAFRTDGHTTLLAGFPWFASWGRDAMISLPGLMITRGMFQEAVDVIEGFLVHLNQGLIPNHFPDVGPPEYNTIDATLWMFQAVWSYLQCGGGMKWVKEVFYPAAKQIISWHERGTLYEIRVDPEDGLLAGGVDGTMLTWMDAKVGDWVVTPRRGKPIEVNALWYNALRIMLHWATELEDHEYGHKLREMAKRAQASFNRKFWNAKRRCGFDVLEAPGDKPDAKLRPNQIFAASLPFPLFDEEQRKAIVNAVRDELLTPVGLRTLERGDPDYRPRYEGDRESRDGAYHNGTVWPWLIGPYVTAYLRTFGKTAENLTYCRQLVEDFEPQVLTFGLGSVAEIYDGDAPHHPRGCIAQAWSVGELLRVLRSDLAP